MCNRERATSNGLLLLLLCPAWNMVAVVLHAPLRMHIRLLLLLFEQLHAAAAAAASTVTRWLLAAAWRHYQDTGDIRFELLLPGWLNSPVVEVVVLASLSSSSFLRAPFLHLMFVS